MYPVMADEGFQPRWEGAARRICVRNEAASPRLNFLLMTSNVSLNEFTSPSMIAIFFQLKNEVADLLINRRQDIITHHVVGLVNIERPSQIVALRHHDHHILVRKDVDVLTAISIGREVVHAI